MSFFLPRLSQSSLTGIGREGVLMGEERSEREKVNRLTVNPKNAYFHPHTYIKISIYILLYNPLAELI